MKNEKGKTYLKNNIRYYLNDMVDYSDLFYLGYLYHSLEARSKGKKIGPETENWTILWQLSQFKDRLSKCGIHDKALDLFLTGITTTLNSYEKTENIIKDTEVEFIKNHLSGGNWNHIVNDILRTRKLILEVDDTTLNPTKLREGVSGFFQDTEIKKIPEEIRADIPKDV